MNFDGNDIGFFESTSGSSDAKRSILGLMNSIAKYDGIVWERKAEYYNGKKLIDIIKNKSDYKEFIKALKRTEGEISFSGGASSGIPVRAFFRNECSEIIDTYGGFLDKMIVKNN
ncbi:MAG: hypothetical protein PHU94_04935 [Bacilli bacterium]|nr:hypothetical protein [Bacilli bacterium]